jgi:hypothetical protein
MVRVMNTHDRSRRWGRLFRGMLAGLFALFLVVLGLGAAEPDILDGAGHSHG